MPSHWYYGGQSQVARSYGKITGYVTPETRLPGSIMSKSNTGGGGRGSYKGDVIGKVIFHGKKKFWAPGADYHYHQSLKAGENTLEGVLMRRIVNVTAAAGGFDPQAIRDDYIRFMTTPGSHNDTYCGTCHRMFFANLQSGIEPKDCPDNDNHNVDTCDSIIATVPIALLKTSENEAVANVKATVRLTRKSPESEKHAAIFAKLLRSIVYENADISDLLMERFRMQVRGNMPDPVTA
eukprot:CAMPEP_0175125694 /NCGR_PEP_ID=MMETSP0087-20121206/3449_1 /TAXON_ID=136419 /ORGANISM="Unknown Unknown, Strain D1" /LENGTH=236 /DNA_ID=CAMNT_0016407541 /DNA_START=215 /DNA_END=925 /DNA_ORIENTATION=-